MNCCNETPLVLVVLPKVPDTKKLVCNTGHGEGPNTQKFVNSEYNKKTSFSVSLHHESNDILIMTNDLLDPYSVFRLRSTSSQVANIDPPWGPLCYEDHLVTQ
jgi:hypothetical protein